MNLEELKFTLNRYDTYFEAVNNKGSFYIGYNIFVIGGIIGIVKDFADKGDVLWIILCCTICFLSTISVLLIVFSSMPFLKSGNCDTYKSLLFFGSISEMKKSEFLTKISEVDSTGILHDLRCQIFELANGLSMKYKYLKYASACMLVQMFVMFILIFKLIIK